MYGFEENNKNWIAQFWDGSLLQRLIFINVAVYLIVNIVSLLAFWFNIESLLIYYPNGDYTSKLSHWLAASSSLIETLSQPWSVITYMFLHLGLWHLVFNMIFLFFAGQYFVRFLGERRLLSIYIFGGLSGLGLYMLVYSIVPYFNAQGSIPILGASASVMATFIAIAAYQPSLPIAFPFVGNVKLKYLAIFYLVMDFAGIRSGINAGGHIAHLGGALYGFYAIYLFKNGKDIFFDLYPLLNKIKALFSFKKGLKVTYGGKKNEPYSRSKVHSDYEYNFRKKQEQEQVDEILDKISKSGYDSLSKREKDFLFKQSSKNQS
jgi:membrane associated rhomboid family serine protease